MRTALQQHYPRDELLQAELAYESILLNLYLGDRDKARSQLLAWKPPERDGYTHVRRGALLAELGNVGAGLSNALQGLQTLRRAQKQQPDSARLLSEEAWASLVLRNMQRAETAFDFSGSIKDSDEHRQEAQLTKRLADLAAKGIDALRERDEITWSLNAEAQPPSQLGGRSPQFDLGHYRNTYHYGGNSDLREKVEAAFAWLTLIDRVALVPRMGNVRFDLSSYTQAAWWAQYNDTAERVLSIAIRTLSKDVLEPKDDTKPAHQTGWLSRYQVATLTEQLASELCIRSFDLIDRLLSRKMSEEAIRDAEFHATIFSRLVIRVKDVGKLNAFVDRLIAYHQASALWSAAALWEAIATALLRAVEALPPESQDDALARILTVPEFPPVRAHVIDRWFDPSDVRLHRQLPLGRKKLMSSVEGLALKLIELVREAPVNPAAPASDRATKAWIRLVWLRELGLLSLPMQERISKIIWQSYVPGGPLPEIPRHHLSAILLWPGAEGIDVQKVFRTWVISSRLAPLSTPQVSLPGMPSASGKRSWSFPVDQRVLSAWVRSAYEGSWSPEEVTAILHSIAAWWAEEGSAIQSAVTSIRDLRDALLERFALIDQGLAYSLRPGWKNSGQYSQEDVEWLEQFVRSARQNGASFWRLRLLDANSANDAETIRVVQIELADALLASQPTPLAELAAYVTGDWIRATEREVAPRILIDILVGIVAARRMPNLGRALSLLHLVALRKQAWLTEENVMQIELGLAALRREANYERKAPASGIDNEDIPPLRYQAARLALKLAENATWAASEPISGWIAESEKDPLPEMRYLRAAEAQAEVDESQNAL